MGRGDFLGIVVAMLTCLFPLEPSGVLEMCGIACPCPTQPGRAQVPSFFLWACPLSSQSSVGAVEIIPGTLTVSMKHPQERREGEVELGLVKQS